MRQSHVSREQGMFGEEEEQWSRSNKKKEASAPS